MNCEPDGDDPDMCPGCVAWRIEDRLIRQAIGTQNGGLADAVRSYIFNLAPVGPKPKAGSFDPAISRGK